MHWPRWAILLLAGLFRQIHCGEEAMEGWGAAVGGETVEMAD